MIRTYYQIQNIKNLTLWTNNYFLQRVEGQRAKDEPSDTNEIEKRIEVRNKKLRKICQGYSQSY